MENEASCGSCGLPLRQTSQGRLCLACLLQLAEDTTPCLDEATELDFGPLTRRQATEVGIQFHRLGDYELQGELARGGMGIVFRAWQPKLRRHVALKLMLPDELRSAERVRRFRLEAEATARLDHPNIVPIHEIGEIGGHHFLSMKLIQGPTLAYRLARQPFTVQQACAFMATLANAIHYAHQRGVLHRDLKPGNILVDELGQPQVTDFGLARLLEQDRGLTLPDAVVGTPTYMSPEQAAGRAADLTTASDVYSLGVILYEMLVGQPPFRASSTLEILRLIRECEAIPLRTVNPAIPLDLDIVCRKCLSKEPDRRFPTAQAFGDDLRRFLRGEPVLAQPLPPLTRVRRWCRRNPALTAMSTGLVALLFLFTAAALFERHRMLRVNHSIARLVANDVRQVLDHIGQLVEQNATQVRPWLLDAAKGYRPPDQHQELDRLFNRRFELLEDWVAIANWVLMDQNGNTLSRWPDVAPGKRLADRSHRHYFWGALQAFKDGDTNYHVSAVYDSGEDDLRKIGLSVVIHGSERDQPLGVLTAMIRTTSRELGSRFDIHHHEVILISPRDSSTPRGASSRTDRPKEPAWIIHLHPSAPETRVHPIGFPAEWATRENLTFYLDPARRSQVIAGWIPWLAGLAPVETRRGDKEPPDFIVLVQSRDGIALFLVPGLLLTAAMAATVTWRASRAKRVT